MKVDFYLQPEGDDKEKVEEQSIQETVPVDDEDI